MLSPLMMSGGNVIPGVVCLSVCLSLCLSMHRQSKNLSTDLNKIMWNGRLWTVEEAIKFCDWFESWSRSGIIFFHFSTLHCSTIFVNFSKTTVTQYELIFIIIIIYLNTVQYSFIKVQIQWLDIKHKTYEANKDIKER